MGCDVRRTTRASARTRARSTLADVADIRFSIDSAGGAPVLVVAVDGDRQPVPALWLREQSRDPSQLDLVSDQRLFDPHRLPDDLAN